MDSSTSASTSTSKAQFIIRPLLLKAGIPLAMSVAGFICAKIMARRRIIPDAATEKRVTTGSCSDSNSLSLPLEEEITSSNTQFMNPMEIDNHKFDYEQEIINLRHQVEELQKKEWDIKLQLARYHDLKEQESVLMELRNVLLLEKANVELLDTEILIMEAEGKRIENLVVQYLTVLDQLHRWKSENGLLQTKVKKLLRKTKQKSRIIREKKARIEAAEAELLRNRDLLGKKSDAVNQLENHVKEQQSVIDQLQEQKTELLDKLDRSSSSMSKIEDNYERSSRMKADKQLQNEYEQLQKDRADEIKELIYLRWTNACLKHDLMKNQADGDQKQEQEQEQEKKNIVEIEGCEESCLNINAGNVDALSFSKRKKLLKNLKIWVDGSKKMRSKFGEKEKYGMKCFRNRNHSGSHETETATEVDHETLAIPGRKSCSSA